MATSTQQGQGKSAETEEDKALREQEYIYDFEYNCRSGGLDLSNVPPVSRSLLWEILKHVRPGFDMTKMRVPTFLLQPTSFIEKLANDTFNPTVLQVTKQISPEERFIQVCRWALNRTQPPAPTIHKSKPYNPILGEVFECSWEHDGTVTHFIGQQVSHHPPITALVMWNVQRGFVYTSTLHVSTKFTGNGALACVPGPNMLYVIGNNGQDMQRYEEQYNFRLPDLAVRGVIFGSQVMETSGQATISCKQTGFDAQFHYKPKSSFEFEGAIRKHPHTNVLYKVTGKSNQSLFIIKHASTTTGEPEPFVDIKNKPQVPKKLKPLCEQKQYESRRVWHHVTFPLLKGDDATANMHKEKIENRQRELAKNGNKLTEAEAFPVLFRLVPDDSLTHQDYEYVHLADLLSQLRAAAGKTASS